MTTLKSILIGQHVASSARTATFSGSSSNVPDDPIMSSYLLTCLLMNHQGKYFQVWRMQEAGSCTARFPMEDSLLNSHSSKEESSSGVCVPSSTGIYWGISCITIGEWANLFSLQRVLSTPQQQHMWMHSLPFTQCCARPPFPGLLSATLPYTQWLFWLLASVGGRQESKAASQNDLHSHKQLFHFPSLWNKGKGCVFLPARQQAAWQRQPLRLSRLASCCSSLAGVMLLPLVQVWVCLGRKGKGAVLPSMLCGTAHTVHEAQLQPPSPSFNIPAAVQSNTQPHKGNFSTCSEDFYAIKWKFTLDTAAVGKYTFFFFYLYIHISLLMHRSDKSVWYCWLAPCMRCQLKLVV